MSHLRPRRNEGMTELAPRIEYRNVAPDAVAALTKLNDYSSCCSIAPGLRRLVEVRTSQINGCSYCVHVHRRQAMGLGESKERLAALGSWRNSDLFSDAERAALAWTEDVTLIAESGAPDDRYEALKAFFTETEIVDLTFIILSMNAWNRLAISFRREAPASAKA